MRASALLSTIACVTCTSAPRVLLWMCWSGSTRITSAPHSASICVQCGPAQTTVTSTTRTPSRGRRFIPLPTYILVARQAGTTCDSEPARHIPCCAADRTSVHCPSHRIARSRCVAHGTTIPPTASYHLGDCSCEPRWYAVASLGCTFG